MAQKLTDYLLENPLYAYGQQQAAQGASTAPVYSPWQGLARALQGGLGGLFAGQAVQDAKGEQSLDRAALAKAMSATTPEAQDAAIASRPGVAEEAALPIMLQRSAARTKFEFEQKGIDADKTAFGLGGAAAGPAVGVGDAAPPQTAGGGVNPNNIGNVRPVGASTGFQQPPDFDSGVALALNNARAYPAKFNNGQPMSLVQIGQKWAPTGDGANDPGQWARNVGAIGGLDPNAPLDLNDPKTAAAFARGVHGAEHGAQAVKSPEAYLPGVQQALQPQGAAPQTALNVPAPQPQAGGAMTTLKGGLQVPTAALNAALGIRDADKRHEKFTGIIQDAIKAQREGVPLVDIRRPDGSTIKVPQAQAAGMTSAREMPLPGNKEADVNMLQTGDPASPEYAAAHARVSQPQMSQGGQLLYPDVSAYRPPVGAKPQAGPTFKDTPASNFDMEEKMRKTFAEDPAVKNYLQVKPVMEAMQAVKAYPSKAADDNLIAGVVNLYAPGTGSLPREAMFKKIGEVENIPDALKTTIRNALSSKTGMDEHSRQVLLDMAQSRLAPMQREFEARVQQHTQVAKDRGIDPAHVLVLPSAAPASKEGGGAGPAPPPGFRLVTPGG